MSAPSLQDGINQAGSPMKFMWVPNAPTSTVPVVSPEFEGWREEQLAWLKGVAFSDLSHHMSNLFLEGPDAVRLLSAVSANDYENFSVGQAKQFIPVTEEGYIITDGILFRLGESRFDLAGISAAHNWVMYHGMKGKYDVKFHFDPPSNLRQGKDPVFYRYQVQGPQAGEVLPRIFDGSMPKLKFFHFKPVTLAGRQVNVFRHGMSGQAGCEFFGPWEDSATIKELILKAGEASGMVRIGGLAYYTNSIESGWIPGPLPGIYSSPDLEDYRKFVGLYSYEGQNKLHGSFYSENIEDYYHTPYELGYARSISFNHDFKGRAALERAQHEVKRTRVTLEWNPEDVKEVFGADHGFIKHHTKDRVEFDSKLVGLSLHTGFMEAYGTILSLAVVDKKHAEPGTPVTIVWGEHPGHTSNAEPNFSYIRATVRPSPYTEYTRTQYRSETVGIAS